MAEELDYELTDAEQATLVAVAKDDAGEAGGMGGSIGGAIGGGPAGRGGGRSGGARGARLGVRFMKPLSAATTLELPDPPAAVTERARAALAREGTPIDDPNQAGDGSLWGIVGTGWHDLAPALVRVAVEPAESGGSRVEIRATGMEGLIKGHVGRKAVDKIAPEIG